MRFFFKTEYFWNHQSDKNNEIVIFGLIRLYVNEKLILYERYGTKISIQFQLINCEDITITAYLKPNRIFRSVIYNEQIHNNCKNGINGKKIIMKEDFSIEV